MSTDLLNFTANGVAYSLMLTFAGTATSGTVTGISGTVGGVSKPMSLVTYAGSDQKLLAASPYLDTNGISFKIGTAKYNVAYVTNYTYGSVSNYTGYLVETGSTTPLTTYTVNTSSVALTPNVCFVEGTRILTERGEIAVENLRVGDLVDTAGGARRPIKWLGHRRVDCVDHPHRNHALPVRISAHSFGRNRPHRDLWVSPGHALCVDVVGEVLIRAGSLVNGATIQQVEVESVVYWHVELDSHDILLAENLPAESYLEMNNRSFFLESGVVSLSESPDAAGSADAQFCRPLFDDGPVVEAVRAQLRAQAQTLGWMLKHTPFNDLHLVADGVRIDPVFDGLTARIDVPAEAVDVQLVAVASKPCHLSDQNRDVRSLGLCLKRIVGGETEIALDDPRLSKGFHELESANWGSFRWMSGQAALPATLFDETAQSRRLTLELLRPPLPFWVAPNEPERDLAA